MIGRLRGLLIEKTAPDVLVEVAGVGYEVQMPLNSLYQLPEVGQEAIIYTHFVVREDAQLLFGFATTHERALFRELIKANGVGPKLALTILSGMTAEQFIECVHHDDITTLVKLPGVGKKTAERLLVELRDRLKEWQGGPVAAAIPKGLTISSPVLTQASQKQDAISALEALGYKAQQAEKAVKAVYSDDKSSEDLIRDALRAMM